MEDLRGDNPAAPEIGAQARTLGLLLAAIAAGIGIWHATLGSGAVTPWLGGAAVLAVLALAWPGALVPLTKAWLKLGAVLHAVVNPVIMALLFVLAIVPTGLALRLAGKDPLRLKRDPNATSYWVARDGKDARQGSMEDQF